MELPNEVSINGRIYVAKDTIDAGPWQVDLTTEQQRFLADFMAAYSPTKVDAVMGWGNGKCASYVRGKHLSCVQLPDSDRFKVTPQQVAEFVWSCKRDQS
jgi:hypothetical protein